MYPDIPLKSTVNRVLTVIRESGSKVHAGHRRQELNILTISTSLFHIPVIIKVHNDNVVQVQVVHIKVRDNVGCTLMYTKCVYVFKYVMYV